MLEGLSNINWSSLEQAHGTAEHIPEAIQGLVSESASEREAAYWKLDNHVVLQSDLYEAAFYIIPFLIEILESGLDPGREHVYGLLYEIANGHASDSTVVIYNGEKFPLMNACHNAVGKHLPTYLDEVESEEANYRNDALELLSVFPEQKELVISQLIDIANKEKSEFLKNIQEMILELESS